MTFAHHLWMPFSGSMCQDTRGVVHSPRHMPDHRTESPQPALKGFTRSCGDPHVIVILAYVILASQVISGEMDEGLFHIAIQSFHTLTELCQGPCPGNQTALVAGNLTGNVNTVYNYTLDFRGRY